MVGMPDTIPHHETEETVPLDHRLPPLSKSATAAAETQAPGAARSALQKLRFSRAYMAARRPATKVWRPGIILARAKTLVI